MQASEVNLDTATLDWLTDLIVGAVARDEQVGADALLFLLRRFSLDARVDLADPLGAALARELDQEAPRGRDGDGAAWAALFSQAAAISDDPRLSRAAADLLAGLRSAWRHGTEVDQAMRTVDACLVSANVPEGRGLAAEAIDELERVVAGAYRPGKGMSHQIAAAAFVRGDLGDHVRSASALLTAYALTARLPYAMLADELMQCLLRTSWDEREGGLLDTPDTAPTKPFVLNCEAARVFCRLAALHQDDEYRRVAVLAIDCDYARDARRTLESLSSSVAARGVEAAPFGLALAEWLELR